MGSFIIRLYASARSGILPATIIKDLAEKAPKFSKWAEATIAHPSVNNIFDEEVWAARQKERIANARAA